MKKTINDIAELSGFSRSTVSRVLTNSPGVNKDTKEKIEKVINDLNYRPNRIARSLVQGDNNIIYLLVGDITNPFYSQITKSIGEMLFKKGYMVVLCDTDYNKEKEIKFLEAAIENCASGVILISVTGTEVLIKELLNMRCPVVLVNRYLPSLSTDVVLTDDYKGAYIATKHLIELGHKKIGFLSGPKASTASNERKRAFIDAMTEYSLELNDEIAYDGDLRKITGYECGKDLMEKNKDLTAIFCCNDLMATGLIEAYLEEGKKIPDDISVIGYDDSPVAVNGKIGLTTISISQTSLGVTVGDIILKRLEGDGGPFMRMIIEPKLVVRESTKSI